MRSRKRRRGSKRKKGKRKEKSVPQLALPYIALGLRSYQCNQCWKVSIMFGGNKDKSHTV
jgi:hypothetical protein